MFRYFIYGKIKKNCIYISAAALAVKKMPPKTTNAKVYRDYVRKYKRKNCPAYSKLRKAELRTLAIHMGYVEKKAPEKKAPEKKAPIEALEKRVFTEKEIANQELYKKRALKLKRSDPIIIGPKGERILHTGSLADIVNKIYSDWRYGVKNIVGHILAPLVGQKQFPGYEKKLAKALELFNREVVLKKEEIFKPMLDKLSKYDYVAKALNEDLSDMIPFMNKFFRGQLNRAKSAKKLSKRQTALLKKNLQKKK